MARGDLQNCIGTVRTATILLFSNINYAKSSIYLFHELFVQKGELPIISTGVVSKTISTLYHHVYLSSKYTFRVIHVLHFILRYNDRVTRHIFSVPTG